MARQLSSRTPSSTRPVLTPLREKFFRCSTCPSSTATLAMGIETLLVEEFPDIIGVEQIA